MPHLKVKPFDLEVLDELAKSGGIFKYRASSKRGNKDIISVEIEGERFFLEVIKRNFDYLIRADKISRPVNTDAIKKALRYLSAEAKLDIVHSNTNSSSAKPRVASQYLRTAAEFENIEYGFEKVSLEIGFGSGRHILHRAMENPDMLYIGIEIHAPSLMQLLKNITLHGINNIWVVNYDARLIMEMLPSNSLENIYVHFPVPWDKKPHRRVISERFLNEAARVLRKGGMLQLRTDSDNYYIYSLELFSRSEHMSFCVSRNEDIPVISKYEARWRSQKKNIYNIDAVCNRISENIVQETDFSFRDKAKSECIEKLGREPVVKKDFFIRFGKRYRRGDMNGGVIECAFGSFTTPEHKYLEYDREGNIRYFPHGPVGTAVNMSAHSLIGRYVNGC